MNLLVETNVISELSCGNNFSYVLAEEGDFLSTEYKVLHSQNSGSFIPCIKMLYNGRIQLYYLTKAMSPFLTLLPTLTPDSFMTIVANLLKAIIDVKSNGFLSCQNIDISLEKIYVDATTLKVSLVYLPLKRKLYMDYASFENELRSSFVKMIHGIETLSSSKTMQLATSLTDGKLTLEDLYKGLKNAGGPQQELDNNTSDNGYLQIIGLNTPLPVELVVSKDEYIIGKKEGSVDGLLSFNGAISRVHCKIRRVGQMIQIMDMGSANGTYVNQVRLLPNQPCMLHDGDVVRLANSDFKIVMR